MYNYNDQEYQEALESDARYERLQDRIHRESTPGYPPCNKLHPTRMAVISARSEDGTLFYSRGTWADDIQDAAIMNYSIAARYLRMRKASSKFKKNQWLYQLKVRRLGIEASE